MKLSHGDVLNALLIDVVADQTRRALELGYSRDMVHAAVERGLSHGIEEFNQFNKTYKGGKLQ